MFTPPFSFLKTSINCSQCYSLQSLSPLTTILSTVIMLRGPRGPEHSRVCTQCFHYWNQEHLGQLQVMPLLYVFICSKVILQSTINVLNNTYSCVNDHNDTIELLCCMKLLNEQNWPYFFLRFKKIYKIQNKIVSEWYQVKGKTHFEKIDRNQNNQQVAITL